MNDANGIGPVAYTHISKVIRNLEEQRNHTVIASVSCFARGVDHCLASLEDHLKPEYEAPYLQFAAQRKELRVCNNILDLIIILTIIFSTFHRSLGLITWIGKRCKKRKPRLSASS